jgi:hypothetical protein
MLPHDTIQYSPHKTGAHTHTHTHTHIYMARQQKQKSLPPIWYHGLSKLL